MDVTLDLVPLDRLPADSPDLDEARVSKYTKLLQGNSSPPPIVVQLTGGGRRWCVVSDGRHRVAAARRCGLRYLVAAIVRNLDVQRQLLTTMRDMGGEGVWATQYPLSLVR